MLLMIDNYDSFTFNLVQYFGELGEDVRTVRNDELSLADIEALSPQRIVISPGPCSPAEAGISVPVLKHFAGKVPILGVCLGHQAIGVAWGAKVDRAPELLHGKTSQVEHNGAGMLAGLPNPFTATRYHSLTVLPETIPDEFEVTGRTASGVVMGMRHKELPVEGVQFHPESVLTQCGHRMLANWMASAGHPVTEELVNELEEATRALQQSAVA